MIEWIMECIIRQICDITAWIPVFVMLGGAIMQTIYEEHSLKKKMKKLERYGY